MKRLLLLFLASASAAFAETRPNVVVFLADDQGWGDLSFNGNTNISTPNIDSLAKKGATLERFYVCPVCSPTRAEFLTGRYHPRGGVWSTSTGGERLALSEKTIADSFSAAGYQTAAFGKWHNGMQFPYHPRGRGFGEFYGFCSGHWGDYFDAPLEHNGRITPGKGFIADDFANHAMQFMETNKDRPFLCYIPFPTPHWPAQVPDEFFDPLANRELKLRGANPKQEDPEATRASLAMTANIDWNVGRVLRRLDELKLSGNTIVIYFSDNGPNTARWNGGMKGRKGSTDEGGVRAPFVIRWPGQIPEGKRVTKIAGAIDLFPTLADLCKVPILSEKPMDGKSLRPLLLGKDEPWTERMIFSHWSGKVSVRTQTHRLDSAGQLFDMVADPGQERDISKDQPELTARLLKAVADWKADVLPGIRKDEPLPFTVGYREFPVTQLPARDGVAHGNIKRSAKAPNCSFFTDWTSGTDSITWDVEVATAGNYEATVYYTCAASDVGSKVELSLNDSRTEATVSEPNDPPLRGKENDRVSRETESYVKDFKPMNLGTLALKPGRGQLTFKALSVPGTHVMDVRQINLTLVR